MVVDRNLAVAVAVGVGSSLVAAIVANSQAYRKTTNELSGSEAMGPLPGMD